MSSSAGYFAFGFLAGVIVAAAVQAVRRAEEEETIETLSLRILQDLDRLESRTTGNPAR